MSDIFIAFSSSDRARITPLVCALESRGWSVFWDTTLLPGETWRRKIDKELDATRCVIVLWSESSVESHWVEQEAEEGLHRGILVPAMIDPVTIPLGFRNLHAANLVGWNGEPEFGDFLKLERALVAVLGVPRAHEAAALHDPQPLNEGKLILVGFGAVGKTTLVNRLVLNRPFDQYERKTDGIQISDWSIACTDAPHLIRLHVWDFGGQEIMHATHQFFLTERALYLVVLGGREGREDADAEYWLNMVSTFGKDPPVIVALNKIKQHPFDVNRRALQKKFPNLCAFFETDCEDDTGIPELASALSAQIGRMPHIFDLFPAPWIEIKARIENATEDFLSYNEFRQLCGDVGEGDPDSQDRLATFLHVLGIALNYRNDARLCDLYVLKPRWITEAIYSILNDKTIARDHGELTLDRLPKILDACRYPANRHFYLLELMRKFELCIAFPEEDRYLITELLDKQEPEFVDQMTAADLALEYHYSPLLPEGLIPRFIVRTSALSVDQPRWRTGVILTFEGNTALVKADPLRRLVQISITGAHAGRRRLLAIIRSDLEVIHRSPPIQAYGMVPVEGYPGLLVSYDKLLAYRKKNKKDIEEVYGEEILSLDVNSLLDGTDVENTAVLADRTIFSPIVEMFISYSHKDQTLRDELGTHLKILQRTGTITKWDDRCIAPGDDWRGQINQAVNEANIILLLVSANFIASDYCWDVEMKRALERADEGSARVVPIIIRPCVWKDAPFARFQALPAGGTAVTAANSRPARDRSWTKVAESLSTLAMELQRSAPRRVAR